MDTVENPSSHLVGGVLGVLDNHGCGDVGGLNLVHGRGGLRALLLPVLRLHHLFHFAVREEEGDGTVREEVKRVDVAREGREGKKA